MFVDYRLAKTRVAAKRVPMSLIVESKTLGTKVPYKLNTLNISKSGMLLGKPGDGKIPFHINTILELVIDPAGSFLKTPVTCLAKVVRCEASKDETAGASSGRKAVSSYGVQIIQFETDDAAVWENCLSDLELLSAPVNFAA